MKKLVSLVMVLALVLGLAAVVSATDLSYDAENNFWGIDDGFGSVMAIDNPDGTYTLTLTEAATDVGIIVAYGIATNGYAMTIAGDTEFTVNYDMMQNGLTPVGGSVSVTLSGMSGGTVYLTAPAGTYTVTFKAPTKGVMGAPDEIEAIEGVDGYFGGYADSEISTITDNYDGSYTFVVAPPADDTYNGQYFYTINTSYCDYYMTLSDVVVTIPDGQAVEGAEVDWSVMLNTSMGYIDLMASEPEETSATVGFKFDYDNYPAMPGTLTVFAAQFKDTNNDGWPEMVGPATISFKLTTKEPEQFSELAPYYKEILEMPDVFKTITIEPSEGDNLYKLDYIYYEIANAQAIGGVITIEDADAVIKYNGNIYTADDDDDDDDKVLTVQLKYDDTAFVVGIANVGEAAKRFDVSIDLIEGFVMKPVDLVIGKNNVVLDQYYGDEMYYGAFYCFTWTAPEAGTISISDIIAAIPEEYADAYPEDLVVKAVITMYKNFDLEQGGELIDGDSAQVAEGDTILVHVAVERDEDDYTYYAADVSFNASFMSDAEANPTVITNAGDLSSIDVDAGGKTYLAINGMLNGQILTIVGDDNTVVYYGDNQVQGDNGVFTIELTGTPTNKVVVINNGDKDASYVAGIAFPEGTEGNPIVVNPVAGEVKAEAAAGSTTYYVINGSYNGNYLVVEGTGLTVTVNGTEVKASNGKYVVELTGTPVNSIVITNAGTAAATYSIVTSDNPPTGDAGILMPVAAALVSVMGAAMLVIKKKEN